MSNVYDILFVDTAPLSGALSLSLKEMQLFNFSTDDNLLEVEQFGKGVLRLCSGHNFNAEISEGNQSLEIDNYIDSSGRRVTVQYFAPLMDHELNAKKKLYEKPYQSNWNGYLLPGREVKELRISA